MENEDGKWRFIKYLYLVSYKDHKLFALIDIYLMDFYEDENKKCKFNFVPMRIQTMKW